MLYNSVLEMIGRTPVIKLSKIANENMADIYVKLEKFNIGGSIKDRAALGMIETAEKEGKLNKGDIIVEPTSGNTGIALAMIGRVKGYRVTIVMPETMSKERRNMIKAYGADLILTDGSKGMKGAIEKAYDIAENKKGYFIPQQFNNMANSRKHYQTTAEEIIKDIPEIDAFVVGIGTGGTVSGVGKKLKQYNQNIKVFGVEPQNSAVLSGSQPGPHKIQGIGAGFVPEILDRTVIDEISTISDEEAYKTTRKVAKEEGLLLGISSGANIAAALKIAKKFGKGKSIVTVAPDGGEKYLSMDIFI